jgi:peptidoglycan hydrolase CwlO-like protein
MELQSSKKLVEDQLQKTQSQLDDLSSERDNLENELRDMRADLNEKAQLILKLVNNDKDNKAILTKLEKTKDEVRSIETATIGSI